MNDVQWNRVTLNDRFIDLIFTYTPYDTNGVMDREGVRRSEIQSKSWRLTTPRSGPKPLIDLSYKRVPENFCYEASFKIGNLYLQVDSIWIDKIEARLGYLNRNDDKNIAQLLTPISDKEAKNDVYSESITFQVFSSYTPEPGPDGYTVFECIVAHADMFNEEGFTFTYYMSEKWTVRAVLEESFQKLGMDLSLHIPDDFLDGKKDASGKLTEPHLFSQKPIETTTFNNAYAVIGFLQKQLNNLAKNYEYNEEVKNEKGEVTKTIRHKGATISPIIFGNTVTLAMQGKDGKVLQTKQEPSIHVTKLRLTSSVDWNAGILTVKAPWVPRVVPGSIIEVPVKYYQGSHGLPNDVARLGSQRDSQDRYYVILQEVKFSTTSMNEMTLKAVPLALAPNATRTTPSKLDVQSLEDFAKAMNNPIDIVFNGDSKTNTEKTQKQLKVASELADVRLAIPTSKTGQYTIRQGDKLSILTKEGLYDLKDNGDGSTSKIILKQFPDLVCLVNSDVRRVSGFHAMYPILAMLTYNTYVSSSPKNARFKIDPTNPDLIYPGNYLVYPTINWQELQTGYKTDISKAWEVCSKYYKARGETSWAKSLDEAIYIWNNGIAR